MNPESKTVITNAIDFILKGVEVEDRETNSASSKWSTNADTGFDVLDRQIDTLSETLRIVEAQIQSRISQVKRRRNNLSPIHRLPNEILIEIFRNAATEPPASRSYYRRLGTLSCVCTRWASVIDQAVTLWNILFADENPRMMDKIMAKSGNCPLSLSILECRCRTMGAILTRLCPQVHRWKHVELVARNKDVAHLKTYLANAAAPQLKRLWVSGVGLQRSNNGPLELFRGGAEQLEELKISRVSVALTPQILPHLRILHLAFIYDGTATTSQFLTVLTQCPNLSELQISHCHMHECVLSDASPRFELPHLRSLDFDNVSPPIAAFSILNGISSPKYEHFRLVSDYPIEALPNIDVLLENVSHVVPSLVHLVDSAENIVINLDGISCQYFTRTAGRETHLELDIAHASWLSVLEWATSAFGDAMKNVETQVAISRNVHPSDEELAALGRVPLVTALDLSGDQTSAIRYLSTPTSVHHKQRWPLCKLASLTIDVGANKPHEVLDMVESRYGHNLKSKKARTKAQLPCPLVNLVIHGPEGTLDPRTLTHIHKVVGEKKVEWRIDEDDEDDEFYSDGYSYGDGHSYDGDYPYADSVDFEGSDGIDPELVDFAF